MAHRKSADSTPRIVDVVLYFDAPEDVVIESLRLMQSEFAHHVEGEHLIIFVLGPDDDNPECGIPKGCCRMVVQTRRYSEWTVRKSCEFAAMRFSAKYKSAYIRKHNCERHNLDLTKEWVDDFDGYLKRTMAEAEKILAKEEEIKIDVTWY